MASVAFKKTRCPKCGLITEHFLNSPTVNGKQVTTCKCGYIYENSANVYTEYNPDPFKDFSTQELEAELIRRRGYA